MQYRYQSSLAPNDAEVVKIKHAAIMSVNIIGLDQVLCLFSCRNLGLVFAAAFHLVFALWSPVRCCTHRFVVVVAVGGGVVRVGIVGDVNASGKNRRNCAEGALRLCCSCPTVTCVVLLLRALCCR